MTIKTKWLLQQTDISRAAVERDWMSLQYNSIPLIGFGLIKTLSALQT